jgi:hypothetical protein
MPRPDFQDYLVHASHKALYRYWYSRRAADGIPRKRSFDPAQTGALAPALGIVEVVRQESRIRFRHRYSGADIVRHSGHDVTGLWFDEAYSGNHLRQSHVDYVEAAALRRPVVAQRAFPLQDGSELLYDRLILPLIGDEQMVDAIVHLPVFLGRNGVEISQPTVRSGILTKRRARGARRHAVE